MTDIKIIDAPEEKSTLRYISERGLTTIAWSIWLYFLLPVLTLILWWFSADTAYETFFDHPVDVQGFLTMLGRIGIAAVVSFVVIRGWAYYNLIRFGKKNRRKRLDLGEKEYQLLADFHHMDILLLQDLRSEKEVVWAPGLTESIPVQPWLASKHEKLSATPNEEYKGHNQPLDVEEIGKTEPAGKVVSDSVAILVTIAIIFAVACMFVFVDFKLYSDGDQYEVSGHKQDVFVAHDDVSLTPSIKSSLTPHSQNPVIKGHLAGRTSPIVRPSQVAKPVVSASAGVVQLPKVSANHKQKTDVTARGALEDWRKAWSTQDIDAYFAAYSDDFKGGNRFRTRADWESYKRRVILKRSYIRVTLKDVEVVNKGDQMLKITFKQHFQSNSYHSDDHKTLWLKNIHGTWKIFREVSSPINKGK